LRIEPRRERHRGLARRESAREPGGGPSKEFMEDLLKHPFTIGLGVGATLAVLTWFSGVLSRRSINKELKDLKKHLNMQMSITTKGTESMQKELDSLKLQNENLRVSVASLQQKPGRAEVRTLQIYDRAVGLMQKRAPGFAPVWQEVLGEAEEEMGRNEGGFGKLLKKVFRPSQIQETAPAPEDAGGGDESQRKAGPSRDPAA
jgi:hypothetical protein